MLALEKPLVSVIVTRKAYVPAELKVAVVFLAVAVWLALKVGRRSPAGQGKGRPGVGQLASPVGSWPRTERLAVWPPTGSSDAAAGVATVGCCRLAVMLKAAEMARGEPAVRGDQRIALARRVDAQPGEGGHAVDRRHGQRSQQDDRRKDCCRC